MNLLQKFLLWQRSRQPRKRVVRLDEAGFTVILGGETKARVRWADVVEIATFKHDLFSIDEICLGFRRADSDTFAWAGEEDLGFAALREEVDRRFTGIQPDWFWEVMVPAFEEKWTTIWQKTQSRPNPPSTD